MNFLGLVCVDTGVLALLYIEQHEAQVVKLLASIGVVSAAYVLEIRGQVA